jgi:hypothetical protein
LTLPCTDGEFAGRQITRSAWLVQQREDLWLTSFR